MKKRQTQFNLPDTENSQAKRKELKQEFKNIYDNIRNKFNSFGKFQEVLVNKSTITSKDLKDNQEPEEFTKRNFIEPLFNLLGYEFTTETGLIVPVGRRNPDYQINPINKDKPIFYVEAEPLNCDLYGKGHGITQVNEWLISRYSKTDYGIAINGFEWILLKFDANSVKVKEIFKVDLRPLFIQILNPKGFFNEVKIQDIYNDFIIFYSSQISLYLDGYLEILELEKEKISNAFYNDYVKYVFGYDRTGNLISGKNLINTIIIPDNTTDKDTKLFAVIFMNRLIFIKFLEEKGMVPSNLLMDLHEKYVKSEVPNTFYESYLKPVFYEVFNKRNENRNFRIRNNAIYSQIPYLNGGLFREIINYEKMYNIENEGAELIINELFGNYTFGQESDINPDILGYIFEKTINFISGTGTDEQKLKGAYYTPDDVVEFIIEKSLIPIIYNKMIEGLKKSGWSNVDLKGYNNIEDILNPENIPNNPRHINNMIESIDSIKILDPACGSGHFLTAALSRILRIQEHLHIISGKSFNRYDLKKKIISNNIFGVDIDANAVEIALLRLWLSIIDDIEIQENIETLPNIDFNIIAGNSLIGWLNDKLSVHPIFNILDDYHIQDSLNNLYIINKNLVADIKFLLNKSNLKDTIKAYKKLIEGYALEEGEKAIKIRNIIMKIRETIYSIITDSYTLFTIDKSKALKPALRMNISEKISERLPFHWNIDFYEVLENGGFDVVIGNPPYIEDAKNPDSQIINMSHVIKRHKERKRIVSPLFYQSKKCGNTHAYFIERGINLLKDEGMLGFIVPISLISTDRMLPIINFIHKNSSKASYYNFDDRPGKIFRGLQHCRSTITIIQKGEKLNQITTSKYHRWVSKARKNLFQNLNGYELNTKEINGLIPKIGSDIETHILNKLRQKAKENVLGDFKSDTGVKIYYYNAVGYWIHTHDEEHVPYAEYYSNFVIARDGSIILNELTDKKLSSHYKIVKFNLKNYHLVNGLLNSSLFYWWFIIWSDGRDLLSKHIDEFPIDLKNFPDELKKKIRPLADDLLLSYDKNSNLKTNTRQGGKYAMIIKEIIPKKSKDIIDLIDDVFAEYFGFNDDEKEFIKTFDIKFRM